MKMPVPAIIILQADLNLIITLSGTREYLSLLELRTVAILRTRKCLIDGANLFSEVLVESLGGELKFSGSFKTFPPATNAAHWILDSSMESLPPHY